MLSTSIIPATRSHGVRTVTYLRNNFPTQAQPQDGTLTITECMGGKFTQRTITNRYLVQEMPAVGFMGRAFLVVKDHAKGDDDTKRGQAGNGRIGNVYDCCLHADGLNRCTCIAGGVKRFPCAHALALRALIDDGALEQPEGMHPIGSLIQPVEEDPYACETICVDPELETARLAAAFRERVA